MLLRRSPLALCALILTSSAVAQAAQVPIEEAEASSTLNKDGISYDIEQAFDGRATTGWFEGEGSSGLGESVEFTFDDEYDLTRIEIYSGDWTSPEWHGFNNRLNQIEVSFKSGNAFARPEVETFDLEGDMGMQVIELDSPQTAASVKITIRSVHAGSTWSDTGISEIRFFDDQRDTVVRPTRAQASSTYPNTQSEFSYDPLNASDGLVDTMWCEHNEADGDAGNGVGEWVEFDLPSGPLSEIVLRTGNTTSQGNFERANRPLRLTATWSDGTNQRIELEDSLEPQTVAVSASGSVDSVKFAIEGVGAGRSYNDACITEITFRR